MPERQNVMVIKFKPRGRKHTKPKGMFETGPISALIIGGGRHARCSRSVIRRVAVFEAVDENEIEDSVTPIEIAEEGRGARECVWASEGCENAIFSAESIIDLGGVGRVGDPIVAVEKELVLNSRVPRNIDRR